MYVLRNELQGRATRTHRQTTPIQAQEIHVRVISPLRHEAAIQFSHRHRLLHAAVALLLLLREAVVVRLVETVVVVHHVLAAEINTWFFN